MKRTMKELANLIHRTDPRARFAFVLWDGELIGFGSPPVVTMRVNTEKSAAELFTHGFTGFGESYMSGEIEVEGDLQELLRLGMAIGIDGVSSNLSQKLRYLPVYLKYRGTPNRAAKNITHHYDRGNDFYALYLDSTMTYSCAYFRNQDDSLETAQLNKYEHIGRKLMLAPGDRLVDIGCGWGGMLIYAAGQFGVTGLGITLSATQYEYANRKIEELGLQDQIKVVLQDYRDLDGEFDKFVSIGMFEHVGREFIPIFMRKAKELLKKGGVGLLHTIGKNVEYTSDSWLERYIFPGSYIPALSEVTRQMERTGFSLLDIENLRMHYSRTLDLWADNFERNVEMVREMFDETFVRMWRLYLHSGAARFKYGDGRLYQILFSNDLNNEWPMTREHIYKDLSNQDLQIPPPALHDPSE
jgi:cyclopropane-fatty-acyl-phospholipid synthase